MTTFIRKYHKLLPYNKQNYIDFLGDQCSNDAEFWYGFSTKINSNKMSIDSIKLFGEKIIWPIIDLYDNNILWFINHDDKDLSWLICGDNKGKLLKIKELFNNLNIKENIRGAILTDSFTLKELTYDLIQYPFQIYPPDIYKNIDISNSKIPLIIKVTGHFTIDVLSKELDVLNMVLNRIKSEEFEIKFYKDTFHNY